MKKEKLRSGKRRADFFQELYWRKKLQIHFFQLLLGSCAHSDLGNILRNVFFF